MNLMMLKKVCGAKHVLVLTLGMTVVGCGNGTNLNKIWGGSDEASDSALLEAKAAYDKRDYDKAEDLALKAYGRNDKNEEAAILLGYIYLSQGGIDPFDLARGLINTTDENDSNGAALAEETKSDGAGSLLTTLGTILNLSDEDKEKLRKPDGENASGIFADNPVYIPATVDDDLRESIPTLNYMNKAIKIVCRFVDVSVLEDSTDSRDTDGSCERSDGPHDLPAKAHFLWAFSHLGEALVYQTALLASSSSAGTSNFEAAAGKLESSSTDLPSLKANVETMKDTVDQVFEIADQAGSDSMLSATLKDLTAVSRAFAAIPGLPAKLTKSISDTMDKITAMSEKIGGDKNTASAKALKGQMTEKFSKAMSKQLESALDSEKFGTNVEYADLPADKKAEVDSICASYDELVSGVADDKKNRPSKCP